MPCHIPDKSWVHYFLFPKQKQKLQIHTYNILLHGSSFKETTRDCLLCFATLTKIAERQDGTHHGRRTFCSPFRQATGIHFASVTSTLNLITIQRVMEEKDNCLPDHIPKVY
ncbi:hypothetical protein OIU84_016793 [Salix udensis]|uniref:Uncharacterized protein n=1 Tax=Salix udensis TaxID=889485 RepID=A0AAD6JAI0_9ROSI|nr:hypothetical protein OIU84_016793 [Salix udensis]